MHVFDHIFLELLWCRLQTTTHDEQLTTESTDPVHPFFALDPTKVDDSRFVHLTLRRIELFGWLVRIMETLTRWAFHA